MLNAPSSSPHRRFAPQETESQGLTECSYVDWQTDFQGCLVQGSTIKRPSVAWIIVAGILVLASILSRVGMIAFPFFNDSGLYAVMGRTVARGGMLYRDFYETKLPGAGLIASIFWRSFGAWWPGYVLGELALTFAGAAILARASARHLATDSFWPTFIFAIVYLNLSWVVFTGFQLETIQVFFVVLSAAAGLEAIATDSPADVFTAGLAAGCAAMVKPTGMAPAVALFVVLIGNRDRVRQWIALAAGVAVPTAVTVVYIWRAGIATYLPGVVRQIQLYGSSTPTTVSGILGKLLVAGLVLGYPIVICAVGMRGVENHGRKASVKTFTFLAVWILLEAIGIVAQRRMYLYHFLPLVAPAALFFGCFCRSMQPTKFAICFLPLVFLSLRWDGTNLAAISRDGGPSAVSTYLSSHTTSDDSLFGDHIGRELIETNRNPGSRYGIFYYWVNYDSAALDYWRTMHDDLEQRRPKYIVQRSDADEAFEQMTRGPILGVCPVRRANCEKAWGEFRAYLQQHYQKEISIDGSDIYRRRTIAKWADVE